MKKSLKQLTKANVTKLSTGSMLNIRFCQIIITLKYNQLIFNTKILISIF